MNDDVPEPYDHPSALPQERLLAECEVRFARRSGPGGQNRNKVETAAILRHRPSGFSAEANERRSQGENRAVALQRLRVLLALKVRGGNGGEGGPSDLWRSRCRGGALAVNPLHEDYPAVLAEAIDALEAHSFDAKAAAEGLGCSMSQFVKFLKREPRAMALLNERRAGLGLRPLR